MWEPLKLAQFDGPSNSITIVHDAAELVEAVDVTLSVLAAAGGSAEAGAVVSAAEDALATAESAAPEAAVLSELIVPVAAPIAAEVGLLASLGLAYQEAAIDKAREASVTGYAEGIFLGLYGAKKSFVERFIMRQPGSYPADEHLGYVEQNYKNAALLRGYGEGRQLEPNQKDIVLLEAARNSPFVPVDDPPAGDMSYFFTAAAGFLRAHYMEAAHLEPYEPA